MLVPAESRPDSRSESMRLLVESPRPLALKESFEQASRFDKLLKQSWQLADLNLRIVRVRAVAQCRRGRIRTNDPGRQDRRREFCRYRREKSSVMVYLANKLWNPKVHGADKATGYSMYSAIAGDRPAEARRDSPFSGFQFEEAKPESLGENDVVLDEWLAKDLQVQIGDEIKFSYSRWASRGELPEEEKLSQCAAS